MKTGGGTLQILTAAKLPLDGILAPACTGLTALLFVTVC